MPKKFLTKDDQEIRFVYYKVNPNDHLGVDKGYLNQRVDAYVGRHQVGYLKWSYIPWDNWVRQYPNKWAIYLDRKHVDDVDPFDKDAIWKGLIGSSWRRPPLPDDTAERDRDLERWEEFNGPEIMKQHKIFKDFVLEKPYVTYAKVFTRMPWEKDTSQKDWRRKGIAVAMYQYAARLLAKQGLALWADSNQTDHAKGLWNYMVTHPAIPTFDSGYFSNGKKRVKIDYRAMKLTSKVRSASSLSVEFHTGNSLLTRLSRDTSQLRELPFMERARIESSHYYLVGFEGGRPVGLWEYVKDDRRIKDWSRWRQSQRMSPIQGNWYSGWNLSVHDDMRRKGIATKLTNALVNSLSKGDVLSFSSLEDDGAKFVKRWLSTARVNPIFVTSYHDLNQSYDPNSVNVTIKGRDRSMIE